MTEPLTAAEWDAIHRAMDRLDRARHAAEPQGPDETRVREAVLEAYRQQGVEVDAKKQPGRLCPRLADGVVSRSRVR